MERVLLTFEDLYAVLKIVFGLLYSQHACFVSVQGPQGLAEVVMKPHPLHTSPQDKLFGSLAVELGNGGP